MQATPPPFAPSEPGYAEVRRLDLLTKNGGYLRVLSYVTTGKYPAERPTQDYVIDRELPHLKQMLALAYPKQPPL
jgi:hypothetical protein